MHINPSPNVHPSHTPFCVRNLKSLSHLVFFFALACERIALKCTVLKVDLLYSILFAGTSLFTFQPGHLTDWGSEGVKTMSWGSGGFPLVVPLYSLLPSFHSHLLSSTQISQTKDLLRYNLPLLFYDLLQWLLEVRKIGIKTHQVSIQTGHNHVQSNKKLM